MSNKSSYDVVFQYDFDEDDTTPKKYSDNRIKRVMAAHEGTFVSTYADYGIKDLSFVINSTPDCLKTILETILKDSEKSDIRMIAFAKKRLDFVIFNISDVQDKDSLFENLNEKKGEISYRKLKISESNPNEVSLELYEGSDKQKSLEKSVEVLSSLKVKDIVLETDSIDFMELNNHKTKKSFDY